MAGLTKQHFNEVAKIINKEMYLEDAHLTFNSITEEVIKARNEGLRDVVISLSDYFKTQNPLFDDNQFKKACLV